MITRVKIQNFKSFVDFEIKDISQFSCLIGLNGTGKTTFLQFIDFVQAVVLNRVPEWFEKRRWNPQDIISFGSGKRSFDFQIDVADGDCTYTWTACFNIVEMRCTSESVLLDGTNETVLLYKDGKVRVKGTVLKLTPEFDFGATALKFLGQDHPVVKAALKTRVFGILDPNAIAQPSQTKSDRKGIEVEPNGKGLVGFISQLTNAERQELFERLCSFYPSINSHKIRKQHFGWKNLLINEMEKFFDSSHLSYGTLRILVFLSQFYSKSQCLLFDEIENGINQELIGELVDKLQHFDKQVIVTTHSALVLNYLSDEAARDSVILLYKGAHGTKAKRFFELSEVQKKLDFLGPGEVMADTNLVDLSKKLSSL